MAADGGLSSPFIKHPVATSLLMVAILLIGIAAYPLLPVAPLPQVDFPTIQVSVQFPGASPTTMASSVAQPLESAFAQISGISEMTSLNSLGSSQITLQFDLNRNIDGAANDVQAAINSASRPVADKPANSADLSQGRTRRIRPSCCCRPHRILCR